MVKLQFYWQCVVMSVSWTFPRASWYVVKCLQLRLHQRQHDCTLCIIQSLSLHMLCELY